MRIKNEDTVKILGSGLGLSTVRKLANMYDGEATVKSEPGVGSTFTVTLHDAPCRRERPPPRRRVSRALPSLATPAQHGFDAAAEQVDA